MRRPAWVCARIGNDDGQQVNEKAADTLANLDLVMQSSEKSGVAAAGHGGTLSQKLLDLAFKVSLKWADVRKDELDDVPGAVQCYRRAMFYADRLCTMGKFDNKVVVFRSYRAQPTPDSPLFSFFQDLSCCSSS